MKLKGKCALITGASRGIGCGIAEVFGDEGADVAVNYVANRKSAEEVAADLRTQGRRAMAVHADVAKRTEAEAIRSDRRARQQLAVKGRESWRVS